MKSVSRLPVLTAMMLSIAMPAVAAETTTNSYDALGRLISSTNVGGPRASAPTTTGYDPAGNRSIQSVGPAGTPANAATVSVSAPSAVDGGSVATFVLTKSGPAASALSVNYTTVDGSAVAPADYAATSGTATFLAWETVKTVPVVTVARSSVPARQFSLVLSAPTAGLTIATGSAAAVINAQGAANQPPVTVADSITVGVCSIGTINVVANDTDPEGNYPLVVTGVVGATLGTAAVSGTTSIRFNAFGGTGGEFLTYTVRDSLGATSTELLAVNVVDLGGCSRLSNGAVGK